MTVYGIEGEAIGAGEALSPAVRAAVEEVQRELRGRLGKSATDGREVPDGEAPRAT